MCDGSKYFVENTENRTYFYKYIEKMTEKSLKEKTIATQYAELNKFAQNEDYERALKAANKILGVAPHEFLALHCKVVCLVQLSKFEEAISLVNKNPEHLQKLIFEKAYCYYRLNKHQEALAIIDNGAGELDLRVKELKAQILYRIENYEQANLVYQDLIKNTDDDYEEERLTNLYATLVYLDQMPDMELKEDAYEICYNNACLLVQQGNYIEAEKRLKQCEKLCREKFEADDELTDEEIELELALINIQLAYVYHKQGRIKEAQTIYTTVLKLKDLNDIALQAVASNNIACINKDQNLFDSKKKMKVALNESLIHKLPSTQRKYIALNNAILCYYMNHPDQCEKACQAVQSTWPELHLTVSVLRALNLVKADKVNEAISLLKKEESNAESKLYVDLCIAQFYLLKGDKHEACKVLENLGEDTYKPGIVGALTSLYQGLGDEATALKVFEKTVQFYKKKKMSSDLSNFWRQAAEFHIKNGHPEVAANSLEELLAVNKDDKKILAQLVIACSQFDKARALKLSKSLPTIEELSKGVDLENIEILAMVNLKKSPGGKGDSLPGTPKPETDERKKRNNKKRKGKLPKNYDASVQPDPERWLPKYERTGYKKKKDRRTKDVQIKGSQGTSYGQSEQFDFSSKKIDEGSESSNSVEPSPRVSHPGKPQHQKKGNQKKKNKRR
ncbi:signal recognition particle subunit SRP72 [Anthonomus grandis grandis]|uniref:signal recognition particle subunit SRP72 n=1 Tax=Anthonomus grandis grandis TaxID=2921223 RepID=UPI0021669785|nr:signal recognition particle subunit SRP72 [Anthonomus grandis grandis]